MKLGLFYLLSTIEAKKRGNAALDDLRFDWQIPKCISTPTLCTKNEKINLPTGTIRLGDNDLPYHNYANYMFEIQRPKNEVVLLKFVAEDGFEMEWHNRCGYDKLHIFTGNTLNFKEENRIARFCGPKPGYQTPFDGSQQIKAMDGILPLWDDVYNTMSNQVIVAIDIDQDVDKLKGFTLEWSTEVIRKSEFARFPRATRYIRDFLLAQVLKLDLKKTTAVTKSVRKFFNSIQRRSKQNLKCNKRFDFEVSDKSIMKIESLALSRSASVKTIELAFNVATDLMIEFVGPCKGSDSWAKRKTTNLQKVYNNLN